MLKNRKNLYKLEGRKKEKDTRFENHLEMNEANELEEGGE